MAWWLGSGAFSTVTQPQSLAGEPKPCFKPLQAEATRDQDEALLWESHPLTPHPLVIAQLFGERLSYTLSWGHSGSTADVGGRPPEATFLSDKQ